MHLKWLKRSLSALSAGTVLASSLSVCALAEAADLDIEDMYSLTVRLVDTATDIRMGYSQYPRNPRVDDLSLELKTASGKTILGDCSLDGDTRRYTFELDGKSELDTFTITAITNAAVINTGIPNADFEYQLYDFGTSAWTAESLSFEYDDTESTYFPTKDDPAPEDFEEVPSMRTMVLNTTLTHTGLCSIFVGMPKSGDQMLSGQEMYADKDTYGLDRVISADIYIGGELYTKASRVGKGVFYFLTPAVLSKDGYSYGCNDDIVLKIRGFYHDEGTMTYNAEINLGTLLYHVLMEMNRASGVY